MVTPLARSGVKIVVVGAVTAVVCVALVLFAATRFGWANPFGTRTVDRSQPALLTSIQELSEYHAAVGNFEVVLDVEKDVRFLPGFLAGERSLFVAAGTVDAYVDFSGLADGDLALSADKTSVRIQMPEAALSKPNLDQKRTYLFSQSRGIVNKYQDFFSSQDQSELYQLAEKKLASAAEESELRKQAEENTRAMLTGMLGSLDLSVTFDDA